MPQSVKVYPESLLSFGPQINRLGSVVPKDKRLIVSLFLIGLIAAVFWSQSRVPALSEKAQMGLRTDFGAIAFDIVLPVTPDQPVVERVGRSSVNWAYTNWKGMTFGLLFAAGVLTLLGGIQRRSFRHAWQNTLAGMFFGAPLGVCVNCATPIAQGMYAAGATLETALATLFSSPTLNPIVLTMAFSLLPWQLGLSLLAGVLLLLASLPWLSRRLSVERSTTSVATPRLLAAPPPNYPLVADGYAAAAANVMRSFVRQLLYIGGLAIPLMLLAGVLGALVIELVPFDVVATFEPNLLSLLIVAVFAVFLPVPMAFNVIIVMALLSSGLHPAFGAVLLLGLGAYSVYPAAVIARYISLRLSLALAAIVVGLAVVSGITVGWYFDAQVDAQAKALTEGLRTPGDSAYEKAAAVCSALPTRLQLACLGQNLDEFTKLIADEGLCETRPDAVSERSCRDQLQGFRAQRQAMTLRAPELCEGIVDMDLTVACVAAAVLELARHSHDIEVCDQLGEARIIRVCRAQYVNASLLANRDTAVCNQLSGQERKDCDINAAIYGFADTRNFTGCLSLPADAQEHCRYVIASAMIGRSGDASGCDRLTAERNVTRCRDQLAAWRAEEARSMTACAAIATLSLREACTLRVARGEIQRQVNDFALAANLTVPPAAAVTATAGRPPESAIPNLYASASAVFQNAKLRVTRVPYPARRGVGGAGFSVHPGREFGITETWEFRMTDFFEPFIIGKGIAAGDYDDDGWTDLLLATQAGVRLYRNIGGRFESVSFGQGAMGVANLFVVAFVDADNDGRKDIFASGYGGRNFLLMNSTTGFASAGLQVLDQDQRLTMAAGFADLDRDGLLDVLLGNWTSGVEQLFSPHESANIILFRRGDGYARQPLDSVKGETNTVLLSDLDADGNIDIIAGNDHAIPDIFWRGNGKGAFEDLRKQWPMIPATSMFTMSLETADFDNDLRPDLFSTDMTFAQSSKQDYCAAALDANDAAVCRQALADYELFNRGSPLDCEAESASRRLDCYVAFSIKAAKTLRDPQYCRRLPDKGGAEYSLCTHLATKLPAEEPVDQSEFLPQVQRNMLLLNRGDRFEDASEEFGVASSYWSWNAQANDLDNDGWVDIYVGNGFHFGDSFYEIQDNVLFHNLGGNGFESKAAEWGLADPVNTPSYVYIDVDRDGDLDIVATGVLLPPRVYVNEQASGRSISVELRDQVGNSAAIGAQVTLRYGGRAGLQQSKQQKLSGGFLSSGNPLHFGVGDHDEVDEIAVRWPDGETSLQRGPLPADSVYRFERRQ